MEWKVTSADELSGVRERRMFPYCEKCTYVHKMRFDVDIKNAKCTKWDDFRRRYCGHNQHDPQNTVDVPESILLSPFKPLVDTKVAGKDTPPATPSLHPLE